MPLVFIPSTSTEHEKVRGRHRGLPMAVDRAGSGYIACCAFGALTICIVLLPEEFANRRVEEKDAHGVKFTRAYTLP